MPSTQDPPRPEDREEEDFRILSELEGQRKEAGAIVQKWFRFRARRGLGVFYSLLSFVPVFGSILSTLFNSQELMIVGVSVAVVCVWIIARMSGLQSFGKMSNTIGLLRENANGKVRNHGRAASMFLFIALWPWIAYAIASFQGSTMFEVFFAVVWLLELVLYRIITLRRNKYPIIDHRVEDWAVIISIPLGAVISAVHLIPNVSSFFGFLLVSPILLFAGIKSLYDAPKELVGDLDSESE